MKTLLILSIVFELGAGLSRLILKLDLYDKNNLQIN